MPSSQNHPVSFTKSGSEQDEWPILSTNDHELLSPREAQSPDPTMNKTERSKAVRRFTGFASIKRNSDRFWKVWDVYVNKPWNMYVLVIIGTLFAVGHHLFYLHLDGKEAINQSMMLRYGTVIAFFAKASLGTAVTIAFHQRAWRVVRFKTARVETIDSIFTANTDFSSLLTWSSIRKAKIGTLLALYCWVTPLVVILTSETLSVVVGVFEETTTCQSVRTLNFENEENVYWRDPQKIDDQFLISLSLWNSTFDYDESPSDSEAEGFDYYHSSSKQFDMLIATKTALIGEPIVRKESGVEICGQGWNCSYVANFVAPGYKCQELASGVDSEVKKLGNATAPFNTSVIAPMGNRTYYAINDRGEYGDPQMPSHAGGRPKQDPPYPDNFGAFRTEPIMWIGYAAVDDLSVPQPDMPGTDAWKKAYTPVIIGCEHYEVNYTAQFNYTGGAQFKDPDKRLKDRTQAVPDRNYIFPTDVKRYRRTAAYHSIGSMLRRYLNGTTVMPNYNVNSELLYTRLITPVNYLPIKNFRQGIQSLYEDMIISLFAEPSFSAVSWAANGKPSGIARGGPSTAYPCRRERIATFFHYNMAQLLSVYAASIVLAGIGVLLGLQAYLEEGAMRDMKPSSIIEASRASSLDVLGARRGGGVKIGYGLVHEEAGRSVRSFGVEGNVQQ
ncbi:uncharacterized protein FFUJ_06919 [Fusarium fujikuroi IMI 58289]|uniref:Uncharacterized protein n=1 Tax=Gibberella fujikuroi (strain CBS 195.34 / IMI 58289 / NRRL A-6831) TaxID=1279085 RepID=S0E6J7_GIBF5|nr:uncharacterized protein FFUJ_06919 [Fusarium fujikuroi IMI 58289]CCT68153.1 uncharacterized protein FFUJ_06919 [Fusarium fujikuroi IMI 58289]